MAQALLSPLLDPETLQYTLGFLEDETSDRTVAGIRDFLAPMLDDLARMHAPHTSKPNADDNSDEVYVKLSALYPHIHDDHLLSKGCKQLDSSIRMLFNKSSDLSSALTPGLVVSDIRHGQSNRRPKRSVLPEKQKWNPNVKPDIVVTQLKARGATSNESKSKDIKLSNFDIQYAGRSILSQADLLLTAGRRYGLVGRNGIGKSTLLRAIAYGELRVPSHLKILHVEQEIEGSDTTALQSVLDGDTVRTGLLEKEKLISAKLTNSTLPLSQVEALNQELAKVYQDLEDIDADKQESNASAILHGLGFSTQQQQAATRTFSGGWRMRLALARCLFCKPDVLLADEVTNYLDFPAVVWLETHLLEFKGTLLVVSHDRSFLDTVSTDILHMHHGQLEAYRGSFSYFVSTRKERQRADLREYESQLAYRQHLQAFIDRWRYNAKRSSQAQSKIKILEKLGPLIPPRQDEMEGMGQDSSVYFRFPAPEKLSPPILQIDGVEFGYGPKGRSIFNQVSLDVQMDSKIALVGPNGAGKSTLVYLLTGQQQPRRGFVHQHGRLRIGLFSQHHVDQVDLSQSSIEFLQHAYPGMHEEEYRRILGRFGLSSTVATQAIGSLSGGQKSRVVFANMAMGNPHILILDEPTNHLDMDTIDALREALLEFQGGIVIVSHDSSFLDGVCTDVCVVDGGLSWFTGDPSSVVGLVTQYKQMLVAT